MRFRKLAAVTSLLSTLAAAPCVAQESAAPDTSIAAVGTRRTSTAPQPRTGWMMGVGLGYGIGGPHAVGSPGHESGGTTQLRFGAGVSSRAVVGVEYLAWSTSPTDSTTWDVIAAGPSLTWYWPSNLYVRGMVGWGMGEATFTTGEGAALVVNTIHDDGFAFLGAVGWEWRWRRRLAIAPEAQYLYVGMTKENKFSVASGSLSLNWYF